MDMTPDELRAYEASLRKQSRDLAERYPGVRPSWVSDEQGRISQMIGWVQSQLPEAQQ